MLWDKLHFLLEEGDVHKYRFLLNLHHFYLRGFVGLHPIESLVPAFDTEIDPTRDASGFFVARFLHDNLFKRVSNRDSAGWSPLCYAALAGKATLVRALLDAKANANDTLGKFTRHADLCKRLPVLSLAAVYHNNDVMQVLLSAHANVHARCVLRATALTWCCTSDNAPGVRLLLEWKADPLLKSFPGVSSFKTACCFGSTEVVKELLTTIRHQVSLRFSLHCALAFNGESDVIACLIEASADVNEQLHIPLSRTAMWLQLKALRTMHYVSPSVLTLLAYHHYGATPLTFCILTGKFEIIPILLTAGARMDIPNNRGKTPADILQQVHASFSWNELGRVLACDEDSDDTCSL